MHFDKDFAKRYEEWYFEEDPKQTIIDSRFEGYESRRSDHLLKGCMVSCASRVDCMRRAKDGREIPVITLNDFETTLDLMKQTEDRMPNVFVGFGQNLNAGTMVRIAKTIEIKGTISKSDLLKIFYHDTDSKDMDSIIETLESMKKIGVRTDSKDTWITWIGGGERM
jgi:hypothetical protein